MYINIKLEPISIELLMLHDMNYNTKIYQHNGVWWRQIKPFFSIPAWHLDSFSLNEVQPPVHRSLVGYLHLVPKDSYYNCMNYIVCLDSLENYNINNLRRETRKEIRRGLKTLDIHQITYLNHLLENGYQVYLSWAKRNTNLNGSRHHNFKKYQSMMINEFSCSKKLFLGAYFRNELIAFLIGCVVNDNIAYIKQGYSKTDYLKYHPLQTLIYSFISICKHNSYISTISLDAASFERPSLNAFKLRQGFKIKAFPAFIKINPVALKLMRIVLPNKHSYFLRYLKYINYKINH